MRLSQHRQSKHLAHLIRTRQSNCSRNQSVCKRKGLEARALLVAFGLKDGPLGSSLATAIANRATKPRRKRVAVEPVTKTDEIEVIKPKRTRKRLSDD